ncbi:MAG: nuclear transport factor 2 family protein [Blastocatellia bacterium]|nr:nuclear transport factor 2 family protein [Blastocatellia bacterium]
MKRVKLIVASLFLLTAIIGLIPVARLQAQGPNDERAEDRKAILAHIDSIFDAFIRKDAEKLRATHGTHWRGYLINSRTMIRGIDEYMKTVTPGLKSADGMADYKILESDVVFYGDDLAVVPYVAEITRKKRSGGKLRVLDVYHKEKGEWIQVASNTATHPETIAQSRQYPAPITDGLRENLLKAREEVWRAYFANDRSQLAALIPEETIAIGAGSDQWSNQSAIFEGAKRFAESGAKLVRLEFPRTEIQMYGDVAIIYTTYLFEVESQGNRRTSSGRGTEIFVRRDGRWVNTGWHLDSGK